MGFLDELDSEGLVNFFVYGLLSLGSKTSLLLLGSTFSLCDITSGRVFGIFDVDQAKMFKLTYRKSSSC